MKTMHDEALNQFLQTKTVVHIFGAGLRSDRPAHTAVKELCDRGWAVSPVHPRDAGGTIEGFPIRPHLDDGVVPEIVVLFLAPERARAVVRNLIVRIHRDDFPLVWFQNGAEDQHAIEALTEMGADFVVDDCIVRYSERHNLICSHPVLPQTWCLQTSSIDGDGGSVWTVHSSESASIEAAGERLEWVGSISDLATSNHTIPRYIRSLQTEQESLVSLAIRLTKQT